MHNISLKRPSNLLGKINIRAFGLANCQKYFKLFTVSYLMCLWNIINIDVINEMNGNILQILSLININSNVLICNGNFWWSLHWFQQISQQIICILINGHRYFLLSLRQKLIKKKFNKIIVRKAVFCLMVIFAVVIIIISILKIWIEFLVD